MNRRPIAFKEGLRDSSNSEEIPSPITPEILLKGHELTSLNVIPYLQPYSDVNEQTDPEWTKKSPTERIKDNYSKLRNVRKHLTNIYNSEFLVQLINQATDRKGRYQQVKHNGLSIGDIVLLKDPLQKPTNYQMGRITDLQININNEVTGATVMKGNKERVKRHVNSLIPLLSSKELVVNTSNENSTQRKAETSIKQQRKAAVRSQEKTSALYRNDLL